MADLQNEIRNLNSDNITILRSAIAVWRCCSFTAAAKELKVSKSTVAKHIISLEGQLHRTLFVRKTRGPVKIFRSSCSDDTVEIFLASMETLLSDFDNLIKSVTKQVPRPTSYHMRRCPEYLHVLTDC